MLAGLPVAALAQGITYWKGGDGDWFTPGNWSSGTPISTTDTRFTNATTTVDNELFIGGAAVTQLLEIREKNVRLTFASGASLASTTARIGVTGTASLTLANTASAAATASFNSILLGYTGGINGNVMTLSGTNLSVTASGNRTRVGAASGSNTLRVESGAALSLHSLRIAGVDGVSNNRVIVAGSNSSLSVTTDTVDIGAGSGTNLGDNAHHNELSIAAGGTFNSQQAVTIGQRLGTYQNTATIEGTGSRMVLQSGAALTVGRSSTAINTGGNGVALSNGGALETNGDISIYGYDTAAATTYGRNYLAIGDTASVVQGGVGRRVLIGADALLRLEAGGTLQTASLLIQNGGLLEAAGAGLAAGQTTLEGGSTLRVGGAGATTASTLTLSNAVTFNEGSRIEFHLFSGSSGDQLFLEAGAALDLAANVTFALTLADSYTPQEGDSWSFLAGNTGLITGNIGAYILPDLQPGLLWDVTQLNAAGSWTLTVIPEPTLGGLALGGLAMAGLWRSVARRRAAR